MARRRDAGWNEQMSAPPYALQLANAGFPVFFCSPQKRPSCPHGFHDASAGPETVEQLWERYPGALIGVPTGPASGFDVVDIDPRHGGLAWWEENQHALPPTRIHETRSGGLHILLRHDESVRNSEGRIAPGVDTRGAGGYVIWWAAAGCSVMQNAPIAAWPLWLLNHYKKAIAPRSTPKRNVSAVAPATTDDAEMARAMVERSLDRLRSAPEGQRHYRLRAAAFTIGGLLNVAELSEQQAHQRLLAAASAAGAEDLDRAAKTATWGLERGRHAPLQLRRRNHGR